MNAYQQIVREFDKVRIQVLDEFKAEQDFIELSTTERNKFVIMVAKMRMMKRGYVPSDFHYMANCSRCGNVPNDYPCQLPALGCVWCNNNAKPTIYTSII